MRRLMDRVALAKAGPAIETEGLRTGSSFPRRTRRQERSASRDPLSYVEPKCSIDAGPRVLRSSPSGEMVRRVVETEQVALH